MTPSHLISNTEGRSDIKGGGCQMEDGVMEDDGFPKDRTILPCGNTGYWDNTGYRCWSCMAIFGSIACPCNNLKPTEPQEAGR
jgi:hypothetical protein